MTKLFTTALGLMIAGQSLAATTAIECERDGQVAFQGLIRTEGDVVARADRGGFSVAFSDAISSRPSYVLDRRTLQLRLGIELPDCKGPYAHVFERVAGANMRCTRLFVDHTYDITWTGENLLKTIAGDEAACSVILSSKSFGKLK